MVIVKRHRLGAVNVTPIPAPTRSVTLPTDPPTTWHLVSAMSKLTVTSLSTDLDLFCAIKAHQMDALRLLYDRYSSLIYRLALRMLRFPEEAEDVTQETFLKLWNRPHLYQPERGSLSNFLVVMARSNALDRLRSRSSHNRFLQRWQSVMLQDSRQPNPLDSVSMDERSHLIQTALAELSDAERTVVEIAYYEGLSRSEIAERLNIPVGTVKSRIRLGLRKLRHALKHSL